MSDEKVVADDQEIVFSEAKDKEEEFVEQTMNSSLGGLSFKDAAGNSIDGTDEKLFPPRDWGPINRPNIFVRLCKWIGQMLVEFRLWWNQEELVVGYKKLVAEATPPCFSNPRDSGADISSIEELVIQPGEVKVVQTGIAIRLPSGYEAQIRSRSGLAAQNGVHVLNSPGTIDETFIGQIGVILYNAGKLEFKVEKGMRIAQLVIKPVPRVIYKQVESLGVTKRGACGFGSTGVK
jgi:dUTP pyrophosphatase